MEETRFPNRKYPRLKHFDYRSENFYFITICTYEKNCIFGEPEMLNSRGETIKNAILQIPHHFSGVRLDKYVVMPNHMHLILEIEKKEAIYSMPLVPLRRRLQGCFTNRSPI